MIYNHTESRVKTSFFQFNKVPKPCNCFLIDELVSSFQLKFEQILKISIKILFSKKIFSFVWIILKHQAKLWLKWYEKITIKRQDIMLNKNVINLLILKLLDNFENVLSCKSNNFTT